MFTADSRMQDSNQRWVKGWEPKPEMGVTETAYDKTVASLRIDPTSNADLIASKKLRAWATGPSKDNPEVPNYNAVFVPEFLLRAWGIVTEWDGDGADETAEDTKQFSDMIGTNFELRG
jgi:hypothetical protein